MNRDVDQYWDALPGPAHDDFDTAASMEQEIRHLLGNVVVGADLGLSGLASYRPTAWLVCGAAPSFPCSDSALNGTLHAPILPAITVHPGGSAIS